jgi:signal transduction histidine kinase/ActR/RegA family two-component response regulator
MDRLRIERSLSTMTSDERNQELEYRLHQQALLAELGRRALTEIPLDALLEEAARLTALGLRTEFCKVLEYLPAENRLRVRAGVGWHEGVVGVATVGADLESPAGYALHAGKPVIANQLSAEERFRTPELLRAHGIQRAINVILTGESKPFGVLEADSRGGDADHTFGEHDIDFLQGVANLLGMAIERKRAHEALQEINRTLEERIAVAVSERRQAEAALAQAQKMEAVGQLIGGVAHDFNNLLTVIAGNLDLAAAAPQGSEHLGRFIAAAQKGAMRGQQLTSQLLAFARRQTLRPETRSVNELIRELDVLAGRILGETIEVEFDLAPDAGTCHVDSAQFGSSLLNLVVNARDAMPQGGKLMIRTSNIELSPGEAAALADAVPGSYVVVAVEDTGSGMPPDVLARALEPFFTTKEVGQGTDLGLSQVYGFVRQSGGFLSIASTPGTGTTVRIHLPEVRDAPADARQSSSSEEVIHGAETILVVEDDEDVWRLVVDSLEMLGYRTLVARSGPEALNLLAQPGGPGVDLLLTDIVMPGGISGPELANEARRRLPGLKILLTSGYAAGDRRVDAGTNGEDFPMLSKPYRQLDLARKVRAVLDEDGSGAKESR